MVSEEESMVIVREWAAPELVLNHVRVMRTEVPQMVAW